MKFHLQLLGGRSWLPLLYVLMSMHAGRHGRAGASLVVGWGLRGCGNLCSVKISCILGIALRKPKHVGC